MGLRCLPVSWRPTLSVAALIVATLPAACSSCSSSTPSGDGAVQGDAGDAREELDAPPDHAPLPDAADAGPSDAPEDTPADVPIDQNASDGGEAGAGGPAPVWEKFGEIEGVEFLHLANASKLRAFRWSGQPADGLEHSERAEFLNPKLTGPDHPMGYNVVVEEHGPKAHFGFENRFPIPNVLFTDGDGFVLEGVKCRSKFGGFVGALQPAVWKSHFALWCQTTKTDSEGLITGVVGELGQPASSYRLFAIHTKQDPVLHNGDPEFVMGESRLGFRWSPYRLMGTLDLNGRDARVMDSLHKGDIEIDNLSSTGNLFLWNKAYTVNGTARNQIMFSNGLLRGKPLVSPPSAADDGSAWNCDTHIAWLRGSQQIGYNQYDHMELWATEFDGDPSHLRPHKIADVQKQRALNAGIRGGWGHFVMDKDRESAIQIWNLNTGSNWKVPLPQGRIRMAGVTKTHFWMLDQGGHPSLLHRLVRFPLDLPSK